MSPFRLNRRPNCRMYSIPSALPPRLRQSFPLLLRQTPVCCVTNLYSAHMPDFLADVICIYIGNVRLYGDKTIIHARCVIKL